MVVLKLFSSSNRFSQNFTILNGKSRSTLPLTWSCDWGEASMWCQWRASVHVFGFLPAPLYLIMALGALLETSRAPQNTGAKLLINSNYLFSRPDNEGQRGQLAGPEAQLIEKPGV